MPKIYLVLVSWNNAKDLPHLFNSLDKTCEDKALPRLDFVIVDNGSEDSSVQLIQDWIKDKPKIKFFQNTKNTGFSPGHNQGIKYALNNGADYVMLLNCDTQVEPDFMGKVMDAFKIDDQVGIVQSRLMRFKDKTKVQSFGNALHYLGFGYSVGDGQPIQQYTNQNIQEIGYASFSAVIIKREVFEKVGLLDNIYTSYHEDTDFCLRSRLQGYKVLLQPKSVVYHNYTFPVGKQTDKNKLRYFWMERNRFLILLKFYKLPTLFLIIPAFLFMEAGQIFFSFLNGFFWTRLKVYGWLITHPKTIFKARREIQHSRKFGDKKLFKHMTGSIEFQSVDNPLLKYIGNPILNAYFIIIRQIILW